MAGCRFCSVAHTVSAATLVHAFVTSRVDYCNVILAGASKSTTDKLQRVLNAAARVVSDTRKYDRGLSHLLHDELHWLDVPQRVQYKLCATVYRCLQHRAPQYIIYMTGCCIHTSDIARRQHLRSAGSHQLFVPRHQRSVFGRRAFSVAGPAAWNSFPDYLRDPSRSFGSFRRDLKASFLVLLAQRTQSIRGFAIMRYINLLLTLILTLTLYPDIHSHKL